MLSKTALEKLNIFKNEDLLHHYPFRYEDLRNYKQGVVISSKNIYTRFGKTVQKILVKTDAGIKTVLTKISSLILSLEKKISEHQNYIQKHGDDPEEIKNLRW